MGRLFSGKKQPQQQHEMPTQQPSQRSQRWNLMGGGSNGGDEVVRNSTPNNKSKTKRPDDTGWMDASFSSSKATGPNVKPSSTAEWSDTDKVERRPSRDRMGGTPTSSSGAAVKVDRLSVDSPVRRERRKPTSATTNDPIAHPNTNRSESAGGGGRSSTRRGTSPRRALSRVVGGMVNESSSLREDGHDHRRSLSPFRKNQQRAVSGSENMFSRKSPRHESIDAVGAGSSFHAAGSYSSVTPRSHHHRSHLYTPTPSSRLNKWLTISLQAIRDAQSRRGQVSGGINEARGRRDEFKDAADEVDDDSLAFTAGDTLAKTVENSIRDLTFDEEASVSSLDLLFDYLTCSELRGYKRRLDPTGMMIQARSSEDMESFWKR